MVSGDASPNIHIWVTHLSGTQRSPDSVLPSVGCIDSWLVLYIHPLTTLHHTTPHPHTLTHRVVCVSLPGRPFITLQYNMCCMPLSCSGRPESQQARLGVPHSGDFSSTPHEGMSQCPSLALSLPGNSSEDSLLCIEQLC